MANVKIKEGLFGTRMKLKSWPNLSVGMFGAAGTASSQNTLPSQKPKMSLIGHLLDKIYYREVSVCDVPQMNAVYFEYSPNNRGKVGAPSFYLAQVDGPGVKIVTDDPCAGDTSEESVKKMQTKAAYAVFLGTAYCDSFRRELGKVLSKDLDELFQYFPIDDINNGALLEETQVFQTCDWFYYAIAKNLDTCDVVSNLNNQKWDDITRPTLQRLAQNGGVLHVESTEAPQILNVTQKQEPKKQTNQNTLFTEPLADFFDRCKNGEFVIDYPWSDKQKQMIVPLSFLDTFFPTESFRLMLLSLWFQIKNVQKRIADGMSYDSIIGKNPINVKVMGKPGTGKTTVVEAVLASLGYPKGLINCKDRMEEDEIEGQNKFIKGSVWNVPTKAGELHSVGGAVVLEEFNLPDPGILQGALGQALAYPFVLKEDGFRELKRHPLTIYFATMNIGVCGTKPMNEALSSRFPEGYVIEDVGQDEFVGILTKAGYQEEDCRKVYKVYTAILNYLHEYHEELVLSVTLRHCLNALDKISIGFSEEQAFESTFLSQLYSSDPDVAADVRETALKAVL